MPKKQPSRSSRRQPSITSITYWRKFATHRIIYVGLAAIIGLGIIAYFGTSPLAGSQSARTEYLADTVATVNGEPILRGEYEKMAERARRNSEGGIAMTVLQEGYLLTNLVDSAILRAEARKRGIKVTNDDINKAINDMRTIRQGSKTERLSDDDLLKMTGMTSMSDLREAIAKDLLPRRLGEVLAKVDRLTYDDLARSYDEVKLRHILIAVTGSRAPVGKGLPEEQARRKAESVLAELRAGADFATLANRYSDDPSNKPPNGMPRGGDLGWYKRGGGFDKTFEEAAFALKPGEISGLVRTPFGFHIIKVEQVRRQLPADFEKNKQQLMETFRAQKVAEAMRAFLEQERPKARIVWKDPSLEWRYAYAMTGPMASLGGLGQTGPEAEANLIKKLRAYVPTHKTDSEAALVLGQMLYRQLMMADLPPGLAGNNPPKVDKDKLRAEVIQCYEIALEHTEDQETRLTLARLYREAKQPQKALDQYRMMHRLLSWDESTETLWVRQEIEKGLRELGDPKMADEEAKQIAQIKAKQQEERKAAAAESERAKAAQRAQAAASQSNPTNGKPTAPPPAAKPTSTSGTAKPTTPASAGTVNIPAPSNAKGSKP